VGPRGVKADFFTYDDPVDVEYDCPYFRFHLSSDCSRREIDLWRVGPFFSLKLVNFRSNVEGPTLWCMKIAWLSFYSGIIERGVEVWVDEVAKQLARRHEVWVIIGKIKNQRSKIKNLRVVEIPVEVGEEVMRGDYTSSWGRRGILDAQSRAIFGFTKKCLPILRREKFDVVIPTNGGWQTALTRIVQWRLGKKLVVAGQSGPGWDDRWNLIWKPDAFVALTEVQKRWSRSVGFKGQVVKIANGVDLKEFNPKVRPVKLGLERPVVLCVGALVPSKRIELAIRAVARMKKGSLVVLGAGELRPKLASLGYRLLGEKRFLLAQVSHEEMPGYYVAADVFTLPTVASESFGIVYVEAMASGCPVVAPDDEIRREIVGEAGLFVDVTNVDVYTRELEEAELRKWGGLPRKQAKKFGWEKVARGYEELFKQLV
jgi:glycosyltransferase involved in cell wall biosynthesis